MPSTLDRRRFLKLGAAASGCAIGCGTDVDGEPPEPEPATVTVIGTVIIRNPATVTGSGRRGHRTRPSHTARP